MNPPKPSALNPKPLNPKKTLNPKRLNPQPSTLFDFGAQGVRASGLGLLEAAGAESSSPSAPNPEPRPNL